MNLLLPVRLPLMLLLAALPLPAQTAKTHHRYLISVDDVLSRLQVEARFSSSVNRLRARSGDAGRYLIGPRDCDTQQQITLRGRNLLVEGAGLTCIAYSFDLGRAASHDRSGRELAEGNVIASPSLWLWRPDPGRGSEIHASFEMPPGIAVSVPWQALDAGTHFRIGPSPESSHAIALFGSFARASVEVPGATLRVAIARGDRPVDDDAIMRWLAATATDVSLAYGRYPNPSPQVVVIPVNRSRLDGAVPFGRVIRDGGETVQLFVNAARPVADYLGDWTATHEFSHLMLPYLTRKHRWISEGFAQYYQNILLARAGVYEQQYAWQKIYDGLERGRNSRPELSPNQAAAGGIRNGLMKIYWSGAAIALLADVQLRDSSDGSRSLDWVLGEFQACCLPADRVWSGTELFRRLDSLLQQPVFMPLYDRYADTAGFAGTGDAFERLGMAIEDGTVRLLPDTPQAEIRNAISGLDQHAAQRRASAAP